MRKKSILVTVAFAVLLFGPALQGCGGTQGSALGTGSTGSGTGQELTYNGRVSSTVESVKGLEYSGRRPTEVKLDIFPSSSSSSSGSPKLMLKGNFLDKDLVQDTYNISVPSIGERSSRVVYEKMLADGSIIKQSWIYSIFEIAKLANEDGAKGFFFTNYRKITLSTESGFNIFRSEGDFIFEGGKGATKQATLIDYDPKFFIVLSDERSVEQRYVLADGTVTCLSESCRIKGGVVEKGELRFESSYINAGSWLAGSLDANDGIGMFAYGNDPVKYADLTKLTGKTEYDALMIGMAKSKTRDWSFHGEANLNVTFTSTGITIEGKIKQGTSITWPDGMPAGIFNNIRFVAAGLVQDGELGKIDKGNVSVQVGTDWRECKEESGCFWEAAFFGNRSGTLRPRSVAGIFQGAVVVKDDQSEEMMYDYWGSFVGYKNETLDRLLDRWLVNLIPNVGDSFKLIMNKDKTKTLGFFDVYAWQNPEHIYVDKNEDGSLFNKDGNIRVKDTNAGLRSDLTFTPEGTRVFLIKTATNIRDESKGVFLSESSGTDYYVGGAWIVAPGFLVSDYEGYFRDKLDEQVDFGFFTEVYENERYIITQTRSATATYEGKAEGLYVPVLAQNVEQAARFTAKAKLDVVFSSMDENEPVGVGFTLSEFMKPTTLKGNLDNLELSIKTSGIEIGEEFIKFGSKSSDGVADKFLEGKFYGKADGDPRSVIGSFVFTQVEIDDTPIGDTINMWGVYQANK